MIVEGQIHGGVAQGIANVLYEKVVYDDGGNILTGSLADYLVPTMAEIPRLEIHHLETLTEASVTGAKGVGEGGTIGAPAAGHPPRFRAPGARCGAGFPMAQNHPRAVL